MNGWINIETLPDDKEIAAIDQLERTIGSVPKHIQQIRELITCFEACHFKYQQHYRDIVESIIKQHPVGEVYSTHINPLNPQRQVLGNHIPQNRTDQQYIDALYSWIDEESINNVGVSEKEVTGLSQRVNAWLGIKSKEKVGLVRMLLARLLGQSMENLRQGGDLSELEYQVERTDNCNYASLQNIERMIQGIGNLKPVDGFDGCGTVNADIKSFVGKELIQLCDWLKLDTLSMESGLGEKELVKVWLVACLVKTIKESAHLSTPLIRFEIQDH